MPELENTVIDRDKEITVSAVWLRRNAEHVEVLLEIDGKWWLAIQENADANFSWIAEARGVSRWKRDPLEDL